MRPDRTKVNRGIPSETMFVNETWLCSECRDKPNRSGGPYHSFEDMVCHVLCWHMPKTWRASGDLGAHELYRELYT